MPDQVQAGNKLVRFRGRADKERTMPLESGKGAGVVSRNISELHTGKTFAKTKKKFGKKRAQKQSVAIALSKARESQDAGHNPPKPHHAKTATKHIPKHLRGRGLISEKAAAAMTGVENAAQARAFQGHKLKPRSKSVGAKPRSGPKVAAAGKYPDPTHNPKHSKFAKRAGHNPPKPQFSEKAVASGRAVTQYDILKNWEAGMEDRQYAAPSARQAERVEKREQQSN